MRILYLVCVLFSFYFCFFDGYIEFVKGLFLFQRVGIMRVEIDLFIFVSLGVQEKLINGEGVFGENGCTGGWVDGRMDGQMDGWMVGWLGGAVR